MEVTRNPCRFTSDLYIEDFPDMGSRVGCHKKGVIAFFCKIQSGDTGDGGLAYATLAGKKDCLCLPVRQEESVDIRLFNSEC
ncbi:hypothetical protein BMS3Abin08_00367 [bacterium BMS3Abin08]|nr:hypothetical protein BMS3Abin08_00367 [bacterium BMS3Abin08]